MMVKKFVILLCTLSLLVFLGCSVSANAGVKYHSDPDIIEINIPTFAGYYYAIDANTGVVYLSYDSHYRHSMTVMLNEDGTPVTAEQLGLEYYYNR